MIPEPAGLVVQWTRPIVADLVGEGRIGAGTLRFGVASPIVAVQLSGSFSGVSSPTGIFGRPPGIGVGFLTHAARKPNWVLGPLSDRTFGARVLDLSIENVELTIWAPEVVYQARVGGATTTPQPTASAERAAAEER